MDYLHATVTLEIAQKELKPCPFCGIPVSLSMIDGNFNFKVVHYRKGQEGVPRKDLILADCIISKMRPEYPLERLEQFKKEWNERPDDKLLALVTEFITLIQGKHSANDTIAKVVLFEKALVKDGFVQKQE